MRVHLKKSPRYDKKFRVTFENDKIVDFGALPRYGRERYKNSHNLDIYTKYV